MNTHNRFNPYGRKMSNFLLQTRLEIFIGKIKKQSCWKCFGIKENTPTTQMENEGKKGSIWCLMLFFFFFILNWTSFKWSAAFFFLIHPDYSPTIVQDFLSVKWTFTDQTLEKEQSTNSIIILILKKYDNFPSLCGFAGLHF